MDDTAKFILERLEHHRDELRNLLEGVEERITHKIERNSKKIESLELWRAKLIGMAMVAGGLGSYIVRKFGG